MAVSMIFSLIVLAMILDSPSFVSSLPSPSDDKHKGFVARLIHRSSPESPFYNPNASSLDLMRASLRTSLTRTAYFSWLRSNNFSNSMKYPLSPVEQISGDFVMTYGIGTPPLDTYAIPDTGSSLMWLQCFNCIKCYKQIIPIFDPAKSSSYQPVGCESVECQQAAYSKCEVSQQACIYNLTYLDGGHSAGNIATETLLFKDSFQHNLNYTLSDMVFGCGHDNSDIPGSDIPGVVGLSNHSFSFVGQLGFGEFSYCVSSNSSSGHSQIRFGLAAIISGHSATALSSNTEGLYYFKNLEGLYIDGEKVQDIPEWIFQHVEGGFGGLLIDSGTTYTHLHPLALDQLIGKLKSKMPFHMKAENDLSKEWDLCYDIQYRYTEVLPEIQFWFKDNKEPYPLSDQNAWIDNTYGQFCLAIGRSDGTISILGMYQQRDVNVGIDLKHAQVSFMYDFNCPEYVF